MVLKLFLGWGFIFKCNCNLELGDPKTKGFNFRVLMKEKTHPQLDRKIIGTYPGKLT